MSPVLVPPANTQSTPNSVSWPSVFWALVPIALNSMTQPAGRLSTNLTMSQSFHLRASPLLCLFDGISAFCSFIYHLNRTRNLKRALIETSLARLATNSDENPSESSPSNLRQLQENDLFRTILFLLGVLPQAVKLYACTGLFWAKVWTTTYLASFTLLEILVLQPQRFLGASYESYEPASRATSRRAQNLINLWHQWYPGIVMVSHLPLIYTFLILLMHVDRVYTESESFQPPGIPGLVVVTVIVIAILILYSLTPRFYNDETSVFFTTLGIIWCLFSEPVMNLITPTLGQGTLLALQPLVKHRDTRMVMSLYGAMGLRTMTLGKTEKYNGRVGVVTSLLYLGVALAYYIAVYESVGTMKPAWAEYLG